jgi:hypothetical protein
VAARVSGALISRGSVIRGADRIKLSHQSRIKDVLSLARAYDDPVPRISARIRSTDTFGLDAPGVPCRAI